MVHNTVTKLSCQFGQHIVIQTAIQIANIQLPDLGLWNCPTIRNLDILKSIIKLYHLTTKQLDHVNTGRLLDPHFTKPDKTCFQGVRADIIDGSDELQESFRVSQCEAFNTFMSVISRLQNLEKFYALIFKEDSSKSEYIWWAWQWDLNKIQEWYSIVYEKW